MRRVPTGLATLLAAAVFVAGCGEAPPGAGPTMDATDTAAPQAAGPTAAPADCAAAHQIINTATAEMTTQIDRAVAAGDVSDARAEATAMAALRRTFDTWASSLSALAAKASDPELRTVLHDYAGAVTATIARVHGPADLEQLTSFDDHELDAIAETFKGVCP